MMPCYSKYKKGDHVQVAKDLGRCMSHFQSDCEAIVIYSYADRYGGSNTGSYSIHIKGSGKVSWYEEHQLEMIQADRLDLLDLWEKEAAQEVEMKSDLDWIFNNGDGVLENTHGATISALAECFGLTNLWGSRGEGVTYYSNSMMTMQISKLFLESGDKKGWLELCEEIKTNHSNSTS